MPLTSAPSDSSSTMKRRLAEQLVEALLERGPGSPADEPPEHAGVGELDLPRGRPQRRARPRSRGDARRAPSGRAASCRGRASSGRSRPADQSQGFVDVGERHPIHPDDLVTAYASALTIRTLPPAIPSSWASKRQTASLARPSRTVGGRDLDQQSPGALAAKRDPRSSRLDANREQRIAHSGFVLNSAADDRGGLRRARREHRARPARPQGPSPISIPTAPPPGPDDPDTGRSCQCRSGPVRVSRRAFRDHLRRAPPRPRARRARAPRDALGLPRTLPGGPRASR